MKAKFISCRLPWILIGLCIVGLLIKVCTDAMHYSVIPGAASPDGRMNVYEISSLSESPFEHAAYGTMLVLAPVHQSVRSPNDGHVFFAGYCSEKPSYLWISNTRISIECKPESDGIRTLASKMYGIDVTLNPHS